MKKETKKLRKENELYLLYNLFMMKPVSKRFISQNKNMFQIAKQMF